MALAFSFPEPNPPPAKAEPSSMAKAFEQPPDVVPMANLQASAGGLALPDVAQLTGLAELMRSQPAVGGNKELPAVAKLRQQDEERRHTFETDLKMLRLRLERLEENRDQFNAEQRSDLVHTRNAMEERLDDVAALLGRDLRRLSEVFETERAMSGTRSHRQQEVLNQLELKVEGLDERFNKIESAISVLHETIKLGVLNLCQSPAADDSRETAEVEHGEAWFDQRLEEQLPGLMQKMGIAGGLESPFDAEAEPENDSCPESKTPTEPESMNPDSAVRSRSGGATLEVPRLCSSPSLDQKDTEQELRRLGTAKGAAEGPLPIAESGLKEVSAEWVDDDFEQAETVEMPLAAALDDVSTPFIPSTALNLGEFMMQLDLRVGSPSEESEKPPGSETANAIVPEVSVSPICNDPSE